MVLNMCANKWTMPDFSFRLRVKCIILTLTFVRMKNLIPAVIEIKAKPE